MSQMPVSTLQAKNRLSARLTAIEPVFDREKARRAAAGLRKVSRGATLDGLKIKDLVNQGRA
jgi:hypothetical protein